MAPLWDLDPSRRRPLLPLQREDVPGYILDRSQSEAFNNLKVHIIQLKKKRKEKKQKKKEKKVVVSRTLYYAACLNNNNYFGFYVI